MTENLNIYLINQSPELLKIRRGFDDERAEKITLKIFSYIFDVPKEIGFCKQNILDAKTIENTEDSAVLFRVDRAITFAIFDNKIY